MLNKKTIRLMKEFIENPNTYNAMKASNSKCYICRVDDEDNRLCAECAWFLVCHIDRVDLCKITDEMLSEMVLDAIRIVAIHEAKHAR